jgi:hypothetical protein
MKKYNCITPVVLPKNVILKAHEFAHKVVSTTNYSDSNQYSISKIQDDHMISKIGEEAVRVIYEKEHIVKGPDYAIYFGKQKSWDHDLYVNDEGLAVKTQKRSTAQRFGLSWTFQAGPYRRDSILDQPNAWVCFVEFDDTSSTNTCYVYPAFQIKELDFKDPILQKLKGFKLVVYAKDLGILNG